MYLLHMVNFYSMLLNTTRWLDVTTTSALASRAIVVPPKDASNATRSLISSRRYPERSLEEMGKRTKMREINAPYVCVVSTTQVVTLKNPN